MKKLLLLFMCICIGIIHIHAQVSIGNTNPQAAFEVESNSNGILIPRVTLTATNVQAPVVNPTGGALPESTLIYNTATAGTSPNNVYPGYYYWDGSGWIRKSDLKLFNHSQIQGLGKYYINNLTIAGNTNLILTVTDSNCVVTSGAFLTWADDPVQSGPGAPISIGSITIRNVIARNGEWVFVLVNSNTSDITGSLSINALY